MSHMRKAIACLRVGVMLLTVFSLSLLSCTVPVAAEEGWPSVKLPVTYPYHGFTLTITRYVVAPGGRHITVYGEVENSQWFAIEVEYAWVVFYLPNGQSLGRGDLDSPVTLSPHSSASVSGIFQVNHDPGTLAQMNIQNITAHGEAQVCYMFFVCIWQSTKTGDQTFTIQDLQALAGL